MKKKTIILSILFLSGLMTLSGTALGRMDHPGTENGMGPMDPGPMRDQETREMNMERGYRFRYGMDTPVTSIEANGSRRGISIDVQGLRFRNSSADMNIELQDRDWEINGSQNEEGMEVSYSADCQWKEEGRQTTHSSKVMVRFRYTLQGDRESIEYSIEIEEPPGQGELAVFFRSGSSSEEAECCWIRENGGTPGHRYRFNSKEGEGISAMEINEKALLRMGNETKEEDISVTEETLNETISLFVETGVSEDTRSLSVSGTLSILEGFADLVKETAEDAAGFIRDHIYSFLIGAAVILIVSTAFMIFVSRKSVDTGGRDLELGKNRYYKGDQ